MYDKNRDAIVNEAMALNAAVDPMLMSASMMVIVVVARTEFTGILELGFTLAKKPENGSAWSRAKANVCREHVARMDIAEHISMRRMIHAKPVVVLVDAVAFI